MARPLPPPDPPDSPPAPSSPLTHAKLHHRPVLSPGLVPLHQWLEKSATSTDPNGTGSRGTPRCARLCGLGSPSVDVEPHLHHFPRSRNLPSPRARIPTLEFLVPLPNNPFVLVQDSLGLSSHRRRFPQGRSSALSRRLQGTKVFWVLKSCNLLPVEESNPTYDHLFEIGCIFFPLLESGRIPEHYDGFFKFTLASDCPETLPLCREDLLAHPSHDLDSLERDLEHDYGWVIEWDVTTMINMFVSGTEFALEIEIEGFALLDSTEDFITDQKVVVLKPDRPFTSETPSPGSPVKSPTRILVKPNQSKLSQLSCHIGKLKDIMSFSLLSMICFECSISSRLKMVKMVKA
ncbi:unnamed protein product [Arabis nemorensis]|uniref:Uncharacterized protein n=1 Tax=Arabis nemorensis TaxID=586526 RepID=A0A565BH15_9BRAS|nr:unnamed protein product [Arabis nemorensis]